MPRATLLRRLGAMLYDGLLLLALLMVTTGLLLPLTGGEAIAGSNHPVLRLTYQLTLLALTFAFFGLFWTRRGQTLGMSSWRLRVEREDGQLLTWHDTAVRLAWSILSWLPAGLGFLWMLIDRDRRAWHDIQSGTRVVVTEKVQRPQRRG
jgi:uncharacterized RDD family membrane protein YckC